MYDAVHDRRLVYAKLELNHSVNVIATYYRLRPTFMYILPSFRPYLLTYLLTYTSM